MAAEVTAVVTVDVDEAVCAVMDSKVVLSTHASRSMEEIWRMAICRG